MGIIQFTIPRKRIHVDATRQAYFASIDGVPWVCSFRTVDDVLVIEKPTGESGRLYFPWQQPGGAWMTLHTATLAEQPEPYSLSVELGRGTVAELREFFWELRLAGIAVPSELEEKLRRVSDDFGELACSTENELKKSESLDRLVMACTELSAGIARFFSHEMLSLRMHGSRRMPVLFGICLGNVVPPPSWSEELRQIFNTAVVPIVWREVEPIEWRHQWTLTDQQIAWARQAGLTVLAGPILSFSAEYFPPFLEAYGDDWEALTRTVEEFVRAAVSRYRGVVHGWLCGGRVNTGEVLVLSEEERVGLAATVVQTIYQVDPSTPIFLSLDQPWGEYLARRASKFPPLLLAESLMRSRLPLAGIHLELAFGYYPGTSRRDLVQVIRYLNWWSILESPLLVTLGVPSRAEADRLGFVAGRRVQPGATPESQATWARDLVEVLLSRPHVYGVFWAKLADNDSQDYSHAGLFDKAGKAKPVLQALKEISRRWL